MEKRKRANVKKKDQLMIDTKTIQKAIEQSQEVKKQFPEFWKFHEMLMELNNGIEVLSKNIK